MTRKGIDSSPVTSPDGQSVAFLRLPGGLHPGDQLAYRRVVMLASPDAAGRYSITRFSPRSPLTSGARAVLSWEPGAHVPGLAWYEAGKVVTRRANAGARWALTPGPVLPQDRFSHIAWSPNGQEIATATGLGQRAGSLPTTLRVVIAGPGQQPERTITIRFRPGALGPAGDPSRGSFPVGDGLTFTQDSHHLLFATVARGEGYQLTGVFQARDTGGIARLVLGNSNGVRGYPPFGPALAGATQFELSPNRTYLATDPNNRFWVRGDGAGPHTISVLPARSCAVSQWTWLPDSSGIAYVTACTIPGSSPIRYRLTLAAVPRLGGSPHILYTLNSKTQFAIDLAPAYRCVACGG